MVENIHNISDQELLSLIEFPDGWLDGEEAALYAELKEAGWNILHEHPCIEFDDWQRILIEQYPLEVVDALGVDPENAHAQFEDMWNSVHLEEIEKVEC